MELHDSIKVMGIRALPGMLVVDQEGGLVYYSNEAAEMLKLLCQEESGKSLPPIPEEVSRLCNALIEKPGHDATSAATHLNIYRNDDLYLFRAVPLFKAASKAASHIMVLIERHPLRENPSDFKMLKSKYNLTEREYQVIGKLIQGSTNKGVASALFISEHTVKDHIKNIMKKLGVNSRALIICSVLK